MRRAALFLGVLVLVPLSACLEVPSIGAPTHAWDPLDTQRTETAYRLGAVFGATDHATNADWFVLTAPLRPEGNLTAFRWRIPEGAVQPARPGDPGPSVVVELRRVGVVDVARDWGFFVFLDNGTKADLVSARYRPFAGDDFLTLSAPTLHAGQGVTFVLAARLAAGQAGEIAYGFHTVARRAASGDPVSPDLGGLLTARKPFALDVVGRATTYEFDYYLRVAVPNGGIEEAQGPVTAQKVRSQGTAAGEVREYRYSKPGTIVAGWGLVLGAYVAEDSWGAWDANASAFGASLAVRRPFGYTALDPALTGAADALAGAPIFLLFGTGAGSAHTAFHTAEVRNEPSEIVVLEHFEVAGRLHDLIGRDVAPLVEVAEGLLPSVPFGDVSERSPEGL